MNSQMNSQIETAQREVVVFEDAHIRPMMGLDILEPLPSRNIRSPVARLDRVDAATARARDDHASRPGPR